MKWILGLKPIFENQVQTWKWKTWKWEAEFQVYFKKSIMILDFADVRKRQARASGKLVKLQRHFSMLPYFDEKRWPEVRFSAMTDHSHTNLALPCYTFRVHSYCKNHFGILGLDSSNHKARIHNCHKM